MSDMIEAPKIAKKAEPTPGARAEQNFDLLAGVSLRISVEVGSASLTLAELLSLNEGSVIELDRQANDLLDIFANGTLVAKGEVVAVEGRYGIRVMEMVAPERGLAGLERRQ
jgi:flagellar motor switch protein FliN/FliY